MLKTEVCRRRLGAAGLIAAVATVLCITCAPPAGAQLGCRGDSNGDGQVTADDVTAAVPFLFVSNLVGVQAERVDANGDGNVTAADVTAIITREGVACPPTPTRTATSTPTATPSPSATPTPTPICAVQSAGLGTTSGMLTASDCLRSINGPARATKVYSFVGTAGMAVTVDVAAASSLVPLVMVVDANGQFGGVAGAPPIEFVVTTSSPYEIWVSTDPSSPAALGAFDLTLTAMTCTPVVHMALPRSGTLLAATVGGDLRVAVATPTATPTFPSGLGGNLDGSECPDPGAPFATGGAEPQNPADTYDFVVSQVPTNVSITMEQVFIDDDIFPELTLLGPDGVEVVSPDQNVDCTSLDTFLFCAQVRFLALQAGTYTIIATGGGGTGRYTLQLGRPPCNPTPLPTIPSDHPLSCPKATPGTGCPGTLYGDTTRTSCAAPLPISGISPDAPAPGSPSDLYTFTGSAGDVISVAMTSEDDGHLYLLGPAALGNPLVTQDDNSGQFLAGTDAQLAATLPADGTYTIVAANNNTLDPPDPSDPTDVGQTVMYTLTIQKCAIAGSVNSVAGRPQSFSTLDCFGFGGLPFRTYVLNGTAGGFVSIAMSSLDVDSFVRLIGPDGSVVENDNDLFSPGTLDARVNRILPADGTYFVEVSTSPQHPGIDVVDSTPQFTLTVTACDPQAAASPAINGAFDSTDCALADGRKFDVYAFDAAGSGPVPGVASVAPPANGCVVALLADGPQAPGDGCATAPIDIPVFGDGTYGVVVAARDAGTRGGYTVPFTRCPVTTVGFGDVRDASLATGTCADTAGKASQWYLFRGLADVVQFNQAVSGEIAAGSPLAGVLTDQLGSMNVSGSFFDDAGALFPIGTDLAALLKIAPAASCGSDGCAYTLRIDPALLRQLPSP